MPSTTQNPSQLIQRPLSAIATLPADADPSAIAALLAEADPSAIAALLAEADPSAIAALLAEADPSAIAALLAEADPSAIAALLAEADPSAIAALLAEADPSAIAALLAEAEAHNNRRPERISNRNWTANRCHRKQTIRACLTETRITHVSPRSRTRHSPLVTCHCSYPSNRFWPKNRSCRKQTTRPRLTGSRIHIRIFSFWTSTTQNPARPLFFAVDSDERASHDTLASRLRNRAARTNKKMPNESWPQNEVEALARELMSAYETGQMIAVPPSARPGFNLNTAYEVETLLKQFREAAGHKAVGRKVGYANKAMWRVLKLETLVWAHMYDDTVHYADNNSATLAIANPRSLKIEPEIVFGLKQPVTGAASDAASALASVDWLALGFEIIDCPFPEWKFQPSDFVASFGLHAALVVGEKIPVQPDNMVNLLDQLSVFKLRISKGGKLPESGDLVERVGDPGEGGSAKNSVTGGEFIEEGSGKNSLKSPALCLAELSAAIARRFPSYPLSAGEIISTGTLTAGHPTVSGDIWTAEVEGLPLPPLTLRLITTGSSEYEPSHLQLRRLNFSRLGCRRGLGVR